MNEKSEYNEYAKVLPSILDETGISAIVPKAHTQYLEYLLTSSAFTIIKTAVQGDLNLISSALESFACDLYVHSKNEDAENLFKKSFILRRDYLAQSPDKTDMLQLFNLSVSALGAKRTSELRLILKEHKILESSENKDWPTLVEFHILRSFLLLCRKGNGWEDIKEAIKSIELLRQLQKEFEDKYLNKIKDDLLLDKAAGVGKLISLYNLAKIVEIAGTYLLNADPPKPDQKLKRYYDNAIEALRISGADTIELFIDMVFVGCDILVKNSIWYSTGTLGEKVRTFVKALAETGKEKPIIELWPSQQEALQGSIFDTAKLSVVLEMPTSGGKTLMSLFAIVQSHALNPTSVVVYVVPTRALVNQITLQLRKKLGPLGIITESAVPVFELDPIENELLKKDCHVLVSTPEKLELLIRSGHPVVNDISLVVVDEVHNLSDQSRGSTLELFLGTVSREKPHARFLLMSPFIPNAENIGKWLGRERASAPIKVDWKPSERIIATAMYSGRGANKAIELTLHPSAHNSDVEEEVSIIIDSTIVEGSKTKENVALSTALSLVNKGGVLMLCSGRESAAERAQKITEYTENIKSSELQELTIKYLQDELGDNHTLPAMIRKGVAFHHAGLSSEARYLIERLVEKGDIKIICATTTLAQGVNFPIRSVVVDAVQRNIMYEGWKPLPFNEFWNIAGRAGRAMQDHVGLVVFSARNDEDVKEYKKYLKQEARYVVSSILNDLNELKNISEKLDRKFVHDYPALARFFQYLLHAITVSNYDTISSDMEDVLRSSLIYYQLGEDDPQNAKKLLEVARTYLALIKGKAENTGFLKLIDGTGFSSMTVDFLWAKREDFADKELWEKDSLFSPGTKTLKEMIDTLSGIPELDLTRLGKGKLDTETIAHIIKDWVNGERVENIADKYFSNTDNRDERILNASRYVHNVLVGQLAWGMSALLKVSLFGNKEVDWERISHVPALMYYGVSSKEAVTLRMMGVPRPCAEKLSGLYAKDFTGKSPTFQEIRNWLNSVDNKHWEDATRGKLSGKESKSIWKIINGIE